MITKFLFTIFNFILYVWIHSWWRHQMETFSMLLPICAGNSPVTGEIWHFVRDACQSHGWINVTVRNMIVFLIADYTVRLSLKNISLSTAIASFTTSAHSFCSRQFKGLYLFSRNNQLITMLISHVWILHPYKLFREKRLSYVFALIHNWNAAYMLQ